MAEEESTKPSETSQYMEETEESPEEKAEEAQRGITEREDLQELEKELTPEGSQFTTCRRLF